MASKGRFNRAKNLPELNNMKDEMEDKDSKRMNKFKEVNIFARYRVCGSALVKSTLSYPPHLRIVQMMASVNKRMFRVLLPYESESAIPKVGCKFFSCKSVLMQ